jgi:large subunit ribosomal protein L25
LTAFASRLSGSEQSMSETLEVKKRDLVGSRNASKLRGQGLVPAVLYGHGEENVNLCVRKEALGLVIRHGSKILSLTGDINDTALLREVQWDTFGTEVLHIDLNRVSQSEAVDVTLPVELHGEAPGTSEGGQVNFVTHELTISCPAALVPDHLVVPLGGLHLGQSIHANEVKLPEGAKMVTPGSVVVVQVVKPQVVLDEITAGTGAEPELIRKPKEETEK